MAKINRSICVLTSLLLCFLLLGTFAEAVPPGCAAGQHRDILIERVLPSDSEEGFERFRCELCGREYTVILFIPNHLWGPWRVDREPTCTEPGLRRRTCTRHTPHDEFESLPPPGHDLVLTTQSPTCEEDGLRTYTCSRCDYTRTEAGEAAPGHDLVRTTQAPACEADGLLIYRCARCDYIRTETEGMPLGHEYELTIQAPTCEDAGRRIYTCARCGDTYTEPGEAPIGHNFGPWSVETPAGARRAGLEVRVCLHCGAREERTIPALYGESPFNAIDFTAGGVGLALLAIFSATLAPCVMTVAKEKAAYRAYLDRQQLAQLEDKRYDFR